MKINMLLVIAFSGLAIMTSVVLGEYYTHYKGLEQGLQQCKVWSENHTKYDILWRKTCFNED